MKTKVLVIGGGAAGLSASWALHKEGIPHVVADPGMGGHASVVAAGLINPITGRKYNRSPLTEKLLAAADECYAWWTAQAGTELLSVTSIVRLHGSREASRHFRETRSAELDAFTGELPADLTDKLHNEHGGFTVNDGRVVRTGILFEVAKTWLIGNDSWFNGRIEEKDIRYTGVWETPAGMFTDIIVANGIGSATWEMFNKVPFRYNKGEAVTFRSEELDLRKPVTGKAIIVPLGDMLYWAGSHNTWDGTLAEPTPEGMEYLQQALRSMLKTPFTIESHRAGIRPTVRDRMPVTGQHPDNKGLYILNGMGTKGYSLSPYHAQKLVQSISGNIDPDHPTSIKRFYQ